MANPSNFETLTTILNALKDLDQEEQIRTVNAVITYLDLPINNSAKRNQSNGSYDHQSPKNEILFSENRAISSKEFLRDKSPRTDVERVSCLAYYLTHYKDTPFFKSVDLSALNTEAAQPKFSNISVAVDNATGAGYLVQAGKGNKQISAVGEIYVQSLPDREAAKAAIANMKIKKKPRKTTTKNGSNKSKA